MIRLKNITEFPFVLNSIEMKGSGSWKLIELNEFIVPNDKIMLSKHIDRTDLFFNPDIPHMSTANAVIKFRVNGLDEDSIKYQTDDIPFYNPLYGLQARFSESYNHHIEWIANAQQDTIPIIETSTFQLGLSNNPFSPNGDGIADYLNIDINYNEYDLIELKIYSLSGRLVRDIRKQTYRGIGNHKWDGRDNHGRLQLTAPYILLFKGKSNVTGEISSRKFVVVLRR